MLASHPAQMMNHKTHSKGIFRFNQTQNCSSRMPRPTVDQRTPAANTKSTPYLWLPVDWWLVGRCTGTAAI